MEFEVMIKNFKYAVCFVLVLSFYSPSGHAKNLTNDEIDGFYVDVMCYKIVNDLKQAAKLACKDKNTSRRQGNLCANDAFKRMLPLSNYRDKEGTYGGWACE